MERCSWVGGQGHLQLSELDYPENYVTWGFVRNPYDRILSAYSGFTRLHPKVDMGIRAGSFESFVLTLPETYTEMLHTRPMVDFLDGVLDFIGRYENLNEDWLLIQDRLGIEPVRSLTPLNVSPHGAWRREYTPRMIRIINQLYYEDFERYNYKMEPSHGA